MTAEAQQLTPLDPLTQEADQLVKFLPVHIERKIGAKIAWELLYEHYADWWADGPGTSKPLSAAEFGAALAFVCERANIRIGKRRGVPYCLDVQLISQEFPALPAPR